MYNLSFKQTVYTYMPATSLKGTNLYTQKLKFTNNTNAESSQITLQYHLT